MMKSIRTRLCHDPGVGRDFYDKVMPDDYLMRTKKPVSGSFRFVTSVKISYRLNELGFVDGAASVAVELLEGIAGIGWRNVK